ncbi:hypothetical protein ZOSMA_305G00180 [Zostera marina]|uniref:Uncharacterized protein n=1 Tax=Zostera marina TaxID=29655 RepID=A0A0K9PAC9_ZOSMR|nr:hypothetical protein ZOSMA_305G00180 [Zostera marina]
MVSRASVFAIKTRAGFYNQRLERFLVDFSQDRLQRVVFSLSPIDCNLGLQLW